MYYRLKLIWCWIKRIARNVDHYRRLFRWWRRGAYGHKPFDTRSMVYGAERCMIELEAYLERRRKWEKREIS